MINMKILKNVKWTVLIIQIKHRKSSVKINKKWMNMNKISKMNRKISWIKWNQLLIILINNQWLNLLDSWMNLHPKKMIIKPLKPQLQLISKSQKLRNLHLFPHMNQASYLKCFVPLKNLYKKCLRNTIIIMNCLMTKIFMKRYFLIIFNLWISSIFMDDFIIFSFQQFLNIHHLHFP